MTMIETANKLASDELVNIQLREIARLRRENAELVRRLHESGADIEIERGKVVFSHADDARGNLPRLAAGKTPTPAHTRIS